MKNLYLLNKILATTKENRLVFMAPKPVDAPASGTETADPGPKPAEAAPTTPKKVEKKDVQDRLGLLEKKVDEVLKPADGVKYTDGLTQGAQEIKNKLTEINNTLKDDKKEIPEADLKKFDKELKKYEKEGEKDLDKKYDKDTLAADAAEKTARDVLKETKAEVTADKVAEKLKTKNPLTDDQKKELKAKIDVNVGKIEKDLDDKLKDPKSTAADKKTAAEAAATALSGITVDAVATSTAEAIEATEKQKALIKRAYEVMKTTADGKKENLKFTEEELTKVMGTYELGKYENPQEKAKTLEIMKALKDNKEALEAKNIHIGFLGGTDGTNYKDKLGEDKDFNDKKSEAFKDLLDFNANGRVSPTLTTDQIASIKAYNTAVAAGMPDVKTFFDDAATKSKFFTGGGIFDLALAYQRAQDRNMQIFGKDAKLNSKLDYLNLELGTTNDTPSERKSGIIFVETEVEQPPTPPVVDYKIKVTGELVITPPKDPAHPNEDPKPTTYELTPIPGTTGGIEIIEGKPSIRIDANTTVPIPLDDAGFPKSDKDTDYIFTVTPGVSGKLSTIEVKKVEIIAEVVVVKTFEQAKTDKDIVVDDATKNTWKPKLNHIWGEPLKAGETQRTNWAIKPIETAPVAPANIEQSKDDHTYTLPDKDGKFKATFLGETTAKDYEFMWDKETPAFGLSKDPNDNYVTITIDGRTSLVEFDRGTKEFKSTDADPKNKFSEKFSMAALDAQGKINITPVLPATPANNPPAAPAASAEKAAAAEALNTTLGTAKTSIEAKIADVETTIDKEEGAMTQSAAKDKMAAAKADMSATFVKVKGLLGEAESLASASRVPEAKAKYEEAQKILDAKLAEAQEADPRESWLTDATKAKIKALRDEAAAQKAKVTAAFEKVIK